MGGWIELEFTLHGKRMWEGVAVRERERGDSSEGVILSIVLCAFLPVTRSPERSRLYHSVYPLFSETFTVWYRNTTVHRCQSFPLRGSSAASRCSCSSSSSSLLYPFPSLLGSSLPFLFFISWSHPFIWNHAESIWISPLSNASCTPRDNLVSVCIWMMVRIRKG